MSRKETVDLMLRMSPELHARCKELAETKGMSLNTFITKTLASYGDDLPAAAETRLSVRIERLEKAVFGDEEGK